MAIIKNKAYEQMSEGLHNVTITEVKDLEFRMRSSAPKAALLLSSKLSMRRTRKARPLMFVCSSTAVSMRRAASSRI